MADTPDGREPWVGNLSLEYGEGGRDIEICPALPGVHEGVTQEVMAGTFVVNTRGPSDISWADSDSGAPDETQGSGKMTPSRAGGSNTDESRGGY